MFDEFNNVSGIYCFENKVNGKKYIGKSINLKKRILDHINSLRRSKDDCTYLQNAWNKYGEENFSICIIETSEENIEELEIFYIKEYNSKSPFGYNLTNGGDGTSGYTWSDEKRKAISGEGNPFYGRNHTEETKKKMSNFQSGDKNHNLGRKFSEETKRKMKENHVDYSGKNHPQWGKPKSYETKIKIAESLGDMSGENNPHFGKKNKKSSSIYFGVYFHKRNSKWAASLVVNKKQVHIGYFEKEEEAAIAYDKYVLENKLNNPINFY